MEYSLHVEDEIRKELTKDETKLWFEQPNPNETAAMLYKKHGNMFRQRNICFL